MKFSKNTCTILNNWREDLTSLCGDGTNFRRRILTEALTRAAVGEFIIPEDLRRIYKFAENKVNEYCGEKDFHSTSRTLEALTVVREIESCCEHIESTPVACDA